MTVKTTPYNTLDYLKTDEDIALYLIATIEDDVEYEPSMLPVALGNAAKAVGMTELARRTGLSRETLYKILSENGNPTYSTLCKLLEAFGVRMQLVPTFSKTKKPLEKKKVTSKTKPTARKNLTAV